MSEFILNDNIGNNGWNELALRICQGPFHDVAKIVLLRKLDRNLGDLFRIQVGVIYDSHISNTSFLPSAPASCRLSVHGLIRLFSRCAQS